MQTALIVLHLVICIALIMIVLLQTGKGSEIGAVFGSSSQTLFGSSWRQHLFRQTDRRCRNCFHDYLTHFGRRSSRVTSEIR